MVKIISYVLIVLLILPVYFISESNSIEVNTALKGRHTGSFIVQEEKRSFYFNLAKAAEERAEYDIRYDPSYYPLDYPGGDVPEDRGVCTDVVIRAFRALNIDLQVKVHEDMRKNFGLYPKRWGLRRPDYSIDHRRVPNLKVFFSRHGTSLPISDNPEDYQPGDIILWNLTDTITHIGIVSTQKNSHGKRYKIVHNIGEGPQIEDVLFDWKIIGHFLYPKKNDL